MVYEKEKFAKGKMNISLSSKSKKKIGFGLNTRREGEPANVFGGDDDSDASDTGDDRAAVNRDLRAEQEALRKRAAASLESAVDYDYDGVYDEMHAAPKKSKEPEEKKSRYIGDLLKAAKQRERERDVIHERKVAKEQAQEEAEYRGKDKFVTKAYKQKLAERELWAQEEETRRREEEKQDVTKKTGDGAFASFYGNLNRNVAMGGTRDGEKGNDSGSKEDLNEDNRGLNEVSGGENAAGLGFMEGFERAAPDDSEPTGNAAVDNEKEEPVTAASPVSMRKAREEKVAQARLRYFQRNGISEESASVAKQ